MWVITILLLLVGGLLGASTIIVARRPDAKDVIDKLVPYQGIIGVVLLLWGVKGVVDIVRTFGMIHFAPFWWLVFVATVVTELGLGFLLAYGLVMKVVGNNPRAVEKAEGVRAKLATYQGSLGVTAIVLSLLFLVLSVAR
jgi:hypothetical protein